MILIQEQHITNALHPASRHPAPYLWPSHCGVRDVDAKYQEEYKVLGNRWRLYFVEDRFCDRSYEANVVDVLKVIIGLK